MIILTLLLLAVLYARYVALQGDSESVQRCVEAEIASGRELDCSHQIPDILFWGFLASILGTIALWWIWFEGQTSRQD
jgi:hypothetical protein